MDILRRCELCEPHIELAIDVFKTKTPTLVTSLKDFLTVLPNPKCIENVLTEALHQLAEADTEACRWLLRNPCYLEPEVDIAELAKTFVLTKLQNQGFVLNRDFWFEPSGRLDVSEKAKAELIVGNLACDRLLLEEILQVQA